MKKVTFIDQSGNELFVVLDLTDFLLPKRKDEIVWMKLIMNVTKLVHNYDKKEIEVWVEIE